jgi:hypothetical protein
MMDIVMTVEEIGMDGGISLGRCSRSTVYRWTKAINEYLEAGKYDWRVKADYKNCHINIMEEN